MAQVKLTVTALAATAFVLGASDAEAGDRTRQWGGLWIGFGAGYAAAGASGTGASHGCLTSSSRSGKADANGECLQDGGSVSTSAGAVFDQENGSLVLGSNYGTADSETSQVAGESAATSLYENESTSLAIGGAAADPPGRATAATSAEIGPRGAAAGAGAAISGTGSSYAETLQADNFRTPDTASASGIEIAGSANRVAASASFASVAVGEASAEALAIGFSGLPGGDISGSAGGMAADIHMRYDYQGESSWLFGAELSLTAPDSSSGANGSDTSRFGLSADGYTAPDLKINRAVSLNTTAMATARLRLGYAMGDYLVYGSGGLAYARYDATSTTTGSFNGAQASETATASGDAFGGVIGGGASTFVADNATISVEGLYYRFGGDDARFDNGASAGLDSAFSVMTTFSIRAN